jgi:hypothetical protein
MVTLPQVTSIVQSSSVVAHEVPITLKANEQLVHAIFELDGGCEVEMLISDDVAISLGLNQLGPEKFDSCTAGIAGGGAANFRVYNGIVEVSFTTGRGSIRSTKCVNVLVGGGDNLVGLPVMGRLRLGVSDSSGTICIFPVRAPRIV